MMRMDHTPDADADDAWLDAEIAKELAGISDVNDDSTEVETWEEVCV